MEAGEEKVPSVVIIGGGSAGWITASVLSRALCRGNPRAARITVIESKRIGIIGVGESTIPGIKFLLKYLDIREAELLEKTQATFKHGIHYRDWTNPTAHGQRSSYFHPFDYNELLNFNRAHWWIGERSHLPGVSYAADISPQYRLAAEGKAPRRPEMTEYDGLLGYAYHLDAEALAEFLAERALKDGVYRVFDDVLDSVVAPDGSISSVICKAGGQIDGDFFVDCTGFAGLLTSKALGVGFESYGDQLFCDRAVAFRVPLDERSPIRPFTTATARKAGWIWEIDLQRRSGVGYVYSSAHVSDDEAEKELRRYIGSKAGSETARHLRMRVGRTRSFWTKNVAAIGLSGGFIEPLESTGIFLIQIGAVQLADSLVGVLGLARNSSLEPGYGAYLEALRPLAKRYTESMAVYYEELRDFIKLHYFLSNRTDSKFWLDNAKSESASESFVERLNEWRTRPPQSFDFTNRLNLFNEHSWLYIMFGMGWTPTEKTGLAPFTDPQRGSGLLAQVHARAKRASESLPDHRAYFRMAAKPVHPARDVEAAA